MSSSVRSGSAEIRSSNHCSCLFSGERLWPVPGLASTLPVVVQRSIHRIAVEAPTLRRRAASRALSPSSTIETTRSRRSFEYPLAILHPAVVVGAPNLICGPRGTPYNPSDSDQAESALERLFVIGAIDNPSFVSRLSSFVNEARRLKQLAIDGQLPRAVDPNASFAAGSSGKSKGHRSSEYEVDRWHHLIVKSLHDELNHAGLKTFSSKHQDMMPDLYSLSGDKKLRHLFEIKTSQETSSLYTAIGQLIVYGADQATTPKRVLVVENPIDDQNFKRALAKQRILVLNFERVGKRAFKFPNLKRTLKLLNT